MNDIIIRAIPVGHITPMFESEKMPSNIQEANCKLQIKTLVGYKTTSSPIRKDIFPDWLFPDATNKELRQLYTLWHFFARPACSFYPMMIKKQAIYEWRDIK